MLLLVCAFALVQEEPVIQVISGVNACPCVVSKVFVNGQSHRFVPRLFKGMRHRIDPLRFDDRIPSALKDPEYARDTGRSGVAAKVARSLEISIESKAPFEVRVTVFPEMTECVESIGMALSNMGVGSVAFQQGMPKEGEEPFEPVSKESLEAFAESFRALGISAKVRIKGEFA